MDSIVREGTQLRNTDGGMLGAAVYLGTFWKATRFAARTQDYKIRDGSVMRVLAFPQRDKIATLPKVGRILRKPGESVKDFAFREIADESGAWKEEYDGVYVGPSTERVGTKTDGTAI